MKINVNNTKFVEKWLESKVRQAKEEVEREIEKIPVQAQTYYDKFVIEVPADDPYVDVFSNMKKSKELTTYTIDCVGKNVLFIEFGAGVYYYTDVETRLYKDMVGNDRPASVDKIGHYHLAKGGRSRGLDDLWFYKSQTGRTSENAHLVKYNKKGEPIMITHGNRPARALYRAVGMAMKRIKTKLGGGKTKRIAPPPMN